MGQLNKALSPLPSSPSHSAALSVISQHGIAEMQQADRKAQLLCAFYRRCGFSAASSLEKSHKEPWLLLWMVYHWIESSQKQVKKRGRQRKGRKYENICPFSQSKNRPNLVLFLKPTDCESSFGSRDKCPEASKYLGYKNRIAACQNLFIFRIFCPKQQKIE